MVLKIILYAHPAIKLPTTPATGCVVNSLMVSTSATQLSFKIVFILLKDIGLDVLGSPPSNCA